MVRTVMLFDPTAPHSEDVQAAMAQPPRRALKEATVGFIDNAKPNFHHLVDDLAALL